MDRDALLELVPHYVAMILLVFVVLAVLRQAVGVDNFWWELAVVVVVVMLYRPLVLRLGYAPSAWRD